MFCRSSLNKSPSEPNDINKTWHIQVIGDKFVSPTDKSAEQKSIFHISQQKICCMYSKQPFLWYDSFEHPKHVFKLIKTITTSR